jgi:hypothetical protein
MWWIVMESNHVVSRRRTDLQSAVVANATHDPKKLKTKTLVVLAGFEPAIHGL